MKTRIVLDIYVKDTHILGELSNAGSFLILFNETNIRSHETQVKLMQLIKDALPKTPEYYTLFEGGTGVWKRVDERFLGLQLVFINKYLNGSLKDKLENFGLKKDDVERIVKLNK